MKASLFFTITFCFLQSSFAESISPASTSQIKIISLPVQQLTNILPPSSVKKKFGLKNRILMRYYQKKLEQAVKGDSDKKKVNILGYTSMAAALLAIVCNLLLFFVVSEGAFMLFLIMTLALIPVSIILGILSLSKRKRLADKSGTSMIPALAGLIIGGGYLIIIIIALISSFVNGF